MRSLAAALVAAGFLGGCSPTTREGRTPSAAQVWTSDQGTFARDPVSGNTVEVSTSVARRYLGETYYFESEAHAREFAVNPDRYVGRDAAPGSSGTPGSEGVR